jgi:hypothetical protein
MAHALRRDVDELVGIQRDDPIGVLFCDCQPHQPGQSAGLVRRRIRVRDDAERQSFAFQLFEYAPGVVGARVIEYHVCVAHGRGVSYERLDDVALVLDGRDGY